jgi:cytosine/uracil/thiamine/allantoin permease
MRAAIADYRYRNHGDYNAWPGPNSNTFVATILAAVPEIGVTLPATAIGKDFSLD